MPLDEHNPQRLPRADRLRVEHMLRTARDAMAILGGSSASEVASDMVRSRAIINCFTEIGEAAARMSGESRSRIGDFPWRQTIGLRNIVVHVYWSTSGRA